MRPKSKAIALAGTFAAVLTITPGSADEAPDIVNVPAGGLEWERTPEGVAFAPLVGDRFAEPYMAMVSLPAGLTSPPHVKSANMFGVVVSGVFSHVAVGSDPGSEVPLPAGSFYKIPKHVAHVSKCMSNADCVTFLYQDGAFDFIEVER